VVRIVYIAPFEVDYGTEHHIARDAEAIGCAVECVKESSDLTFFSGADLILYTRGRGIPANWGLFEDAGTRTASFHLDLYAGLDREGEIGTNPFWRTGAIFTPDGDPASAKLFADRGVNHHWLLPACVSDECVRGKFDPTLACDVTFVGKTAGYHAQYPFREELVAGLRMRYGTRFRLFGHGDQMRGQRLNDLMASAKVVVGDSLMLPGHTRYTSDRLFETIGRGGFCVWPRMDWLDEFGFVNGEHYVTFEPGNLSDLYATIDQWLAKPSARIRIAAQGQDFVREHHTYKHRVREMLDVLGL
jgi:hypothetical protein